MKKIITWIFISSIAFSSYGQDQEMKPLKEKDVQEETQRTGFKKENLFTGGGVDLSLSNYSFGLGLSPVLGYSFNKWFDAGIGLKFTYITERKAGIDQNGYEFATGNKIHQTDIAPFAFGRVYPLKFLFAQAQVEQNIISQKYIYGNNAPSDKVRYDVTSLLLGVGYCSGRQGVGDLFYYISLSVDVLKDRYSPYVQQAVNGSVNILPILKAGLQIPLFQGKRNR